MLRGFLMLAAFFGFTGVALGAFAAHGLKNRLSAEYLAIFHTGVTYQLVHCLALFGVALLATQVPGRLVAWAGGIHPGHPAVLRQPVPADPHGDWQAGHHHPLGGASFLAGWLLLGLAAWRLQAAA